ncbi:MAG TPA: DUF2155 domain-containing protein [Methyloceanibacter sp.]
MQLPEAACAHLVLLFGLVAATAVLGVPAVRAETIQNQIAVFAALDKVTGRISHLEIPINQTVQFGALKVTPRVCDTRPPTEAPHTASFVEVDEIKLTGEVERIFTGWMFADSPGLHAVEHPVFDVWLTNCKTNEPVAPAGSEQNAAAPAAPAAEAPAAEAPAAAAPAPEAPAPAAAEAAPPPPPKPAPAAKPASAPAAPAAAQAPAPATPPKRPPRPKPAPPPSTFPIFGQ